MWKTDSTNFLNYASGEIHWAKVWYADLGEDVCKQLASWTHESITLEACGFNRYYFIRQSRWYVLILALLASHLLDRTAKWNNLSNIGGWAKV